MIRVFIGFDSQEVVAYSVFSHSIVERSSLALSLCPLKLSTLRADFYREKDPLQSTEFSFSRFLVPYLCQYQGWALFVDGDMLMRDDIAKLWALRDERYSVMLVKHNYEPEEKVKFLGHQQTRYAKKNWSSVMLFNNAKCRSLSKDYVNTASGLELHQFKWLESEEQIGALPQSWNHLVGVYPYQEQASLVHFTQGGPYFSEYDQVDYAQEWFKEKEKMLFALNTYPLCP